MKRKARKRLEKRIVKAVKKYGAPAVLGFLSTLVANLVSDSVDRGVEPEPASSVKSTGGVTHGRPKKTRVS
jgi:hypothetical protein